MYLKLGNKQRPGVHKDLDAKGQLYRVGARFEALSMGVLRAVSDLGCIFFFVSYPLNLNNVLHHGPLLFSSSCW